MRAGLITWEREVGSNMVYGVGVRPDIAHVNNDFSTFVYSHNS